MIRLAMTVGITLLALLAFGVYQGAAMTRAQESRLRELDRHIAAQRTRIKVLRADWAFLTKPDRLQALSEKYLALAPVSAAQFTHLASLPVRKGLPPVTHAAGRDPARAAYGTGR
jgi:hypothetical protein